jgi:cytochrome c-type biogenesis protein CcsB
MAAALAAWPRPAAAQTAPEGNAHPQTRAVSEYTGANPFGDGSPTGMGIEAKRAFAERLAANGGLEPLRDLAVFHNGRVKILDTLARWTVKTITGRREYIDLLPIDGGRARKVRYDPLFTLIDLAVDPAYYADKPLIYVEYLPLREAFIERAYADEASREWWKKQGRLTPEVIRAQFRAIASEGHEAFARGLNSVGQAMTLYLQGYANLEMVAPESRERPWRHVATLDPSSPAGAAIHALGAAWRAGDADGVKAAAASLAAELPRINPEMYPGGARRLERVYNASSPFEYGFWLYFLSLLSLLLAFGTGRRWLAAVGVATLVAAVGLHGFGFVSRCILAERFAIQNQFESMTGLSLFAAVVGLVIMLARRQWLFGAAAAGVGFMVLVTATQTGIPGQAIEREAAILNTSVLLKYHVTTVLVSYGLISLGFITSLFYLATHYAARLRARGAAAPARGAVAVPGGGVVEVSATALGLPEDAPKGPARVLSDLDRAQMIILQLAFWTLGVGILLGAWWADHSWGRWWAFDPKETWALVTWIVYLIVVHVRVSTARNRGLITAWLSVVGFIMMLWCYFGVNLMLSGLHAYA